VPPIDLQCYETPLPVSPLEGSAEVEVELGQRVVAAALYSPPSQHAAAALQRMGVDTAPQVPTLSDIYGDTESDELSQRRHDVIQSRATRPMAPPPSPASSEVSFRPPRRNGLKENIPPAQQAHRTQALAGELQASTSRQRHALASIHTEYTTSQYYSENPRPTQVICVRFYCTDKGRLYKNSIRTHSKRCKQSRNRSRKRKNRKRRKIKRMKRGRREGETEGLETGTQARTKSRKRGGCTGG